MKQQGERRFGCNLFLCLLIFLGAFGGSISDAEGKRRHRKYKRHKKYTKYTRHRKHRKLSAYYGAQSLSSGPLQIFINKGTFTLTLLQENQIAVVYPVAIGRGVPGWPQTPEGNFVIENKNTLTCWKKCSPYGTRFMGLYPSGVGIHGTNQPEKIGTHASHGCIRMFNENVEELFEKVPVGTTVTIFNNKRVTLTVVLDSQRMTLSCLPLTLHGATFCQVKPLVAFLGGSYVLGEDMRSLVASAKEGAQYTFFTGKPYLEDASGEHIPLTLAPLYRQGDLYALLDDVAGLFHLKSEAAADSVNLVPADIQSGQEECPSWLCGSPSKSVSMPENSPPESDGLEQ